MLMKLFNSLAIIVLFSFSTACVTHHEGETTQNHLQEEAVLPSTGSFGEQISKENAINILDIANAVTTDTAYDVKATGTIKEVCQHSGCWVTLDMGNGEDIMVNMKNHTFSVPKDAAGKQMWVEGIAVRELISVEMLRHYAEDAGKTQEEIDAIVAPEWQYTLDANGVIIE